MTLLLPLPLPIPTQNNVVIQNQTTGVVDYLTYQGSKLVASNAVDYGLGADFKIVAEERNVLVAQNDKTGFVDFLTLGPAGKLLASAMSSVPVPRIFGFSHDTISFGSQLADGEIDMLKFNTTTGAFTGSSLVAGTVGLPTAVGFSTPAANNPNNPGWNGIKSPGLNGDAIDTQLANGQLDILGLGGSFGTGLALQASDLVAGSANTPPIGDINPNSNFVGENYQNNPGDPQGMVTNTMLASGQIDLLYWDVGNPDTANTGKLYASDLLTGSYAGWSVVQGGTVETHLFDA
jgi:hypothetical protein